jgi:hypothetical protein
MKTHLNRKKKCEAKFSSLKYTDEELYNLSLIKRYEKEENDKEIKNPKKYECDKCKMLFLTNGNLKRHVLHSCKGEVKDNVLINNLNINSNNVTNYINNINIQLVNPFSKKWSTEHIGIDEKYEIFKTKYTYTKTLEKILENDINLNVLIDKEIGYVYNNNSFEKMEVKKIIRKVIEKLCDTIFEFGNEIKKNENEENINIIDEVIQKANIKFHDYQNNKNNFKEDAKIVISDVYNDKRSRTHEIFSNIKKLNGEKSLRKGVEEF